MQEESIILIGATPDDRLHAYDIDTGEELWEHRAPTSAMSTPMTYEADGRQFVVFAAGGHSWYDAKGVNDYVLAYALPAKRRGYASSLNWPASLGFVK